MDIKYFKKYLKYKNKYIELKGGRPIQSSELQSPSEAHSNSVNEEAEGECKLKGRNAEGKLYKYYGECMDGMMHGKGKLVIFNDDSSTYSIYTGMFKNNMKHGIGTYNDFSKANFDYIYTAQWNQDNMYGKCTEAVYYKGTDIFYAIYYGMWENNKRHGQGKLTIYNYSSDMDTPISETDIIGVWDNGIMRKQQCKINELSPSNQILSEYEGSCFLEKKQGNGKITTYDPDTGIIEYFYEGMFMNNMMHGKGIMTTYNQGIRHFTLEGTWINGMKEGLFVGNGYDNEGVNIYNFNGNYSNNMMNGYGIEIHKMDGTKYEGMFKDSSYDGRGHMTYFNHPEFKEYIGDFVDDKRQGEGVMIYHDKKYTGGWFNNMRHGYGEIVNSEGRGEGTFEEDELVEGRFKYKDGKVDQIFPDGRVISYNINKKYNHL